MALRLIQKVSVLFAPRAAKEAQSITTSFMHLSLPDMPLCLASHPPHSRLYFIIGLGL